MFYSLTTFSITFNILSGSISVLMFDPERNHAIYEAITETKTFKIDPIDYKSKEKI